jgi:hypothetical protein
MGMARYIPPRPPPPASGKPGNGTMLLASRPLPQKALVLDYTTINTGLSNYVFD